MALGLVLNETMSGWVSFYDENIQHPFRFAIHAFTTKIGKLTTPRHAKGVADFPGYHPNVPVQGTLTIYPTGPAYDIHFELEKYGKVRLVGKKTYKIWGLRKSLITLPYKIFNAKNEEIGEGIIVYRESIILFPFAAVRFVREEYAYRPYLKTAKKLKNLLNLLFPKWQESINEKQFLDRMEFISKEIPAYVTKLNRINYRLLQFLSMLRCGSRIQKLNPQKISKLEKFVKKIPYINLVIIPTIATVGNAVFGHDHIRKKNRQNLVTPTKTKEIEPWMQLNITPKGSKDVEVIETDVVVVGSGAGGAPLAYELARNGYAVAIVEQGQYFKRDQFNGRVIEMVLKLYRRQGLDPVLSNAGLWLPSGVSVGGTTTVYDGTYFRTPEKVIERWRSQGLDIDLSPYYEPVEKMLNVHETPEHLLSGIDRVIRDYANKKGFKSHPLLRGVDGCDGQSHCILGCPTDAKRSTNVSYIPEAMKENAHLFSNYRVSKILFEYDKAVGVRISLPKFGPAFDKEIRAKVVVVAGGALNTPGILRRNIGKRAHLGEHLTIHPAMTVCGLFNREMRTEKFVPQAFGVFGIPNAHYGLEGYTTNPDMAASILVNFGSVFDGIFDDATRFTNFSAILEDVTEGKVVFLPGDRDPIPSYFLDKKTRQEIKNSTLHLVEAFFDGGAEKVYVPIKGFDVLTDKTQALNQLQAASFKADHLGISAYHPLGTCRMGTSPANSVVSPECEVWGKQNLFVSDGSVIPGPLGVNPQGTIMPNALRVADIIRKTRL